MFKHTVYCQTTMHLASNLKHYQTLQIYYRSLGYKIATFHEICDKYSTALYLFHVLDLTILFYVKI
jgi:hypothetical protein